MIGFRFDNTYTSLPAPFYAHCNPEEVSAPEVVILNEALAGSMGLEFDDVGEVQLAALLAGNELPEGATPFSQAYAGHQFGHFTMLGDGRAHMMGEHLMPDGQRVDIQYKGSGRTPYSRRGDGRAALGPMLREYIISESLAAMGIPTSRSLAVVSTGEMVMREEALEGAILTRVASSHIRVGTFEYASDPENTVPLQSLLDYTIDRHYPELLSAENRALALLERVVERQCSLIVHWMRVGFIHGVMNTDNFTLSGESIDFGPCAFLDTYNPAQVFSSIDQQGRYAFANQPNIAHWNLARLAEALLPLIDSDREEAIRLAEQTIHQFPSLYQQEWGNMMRAKLGLGSIRDGDEQLIIDLLSWMHEKHADYTNTFQDLMELPDLATYQDEGFRNWYDRYQRRQDSDELSESESRELMRRSNPAVIPRNHQVERALQAAQTGDLAPLHLLLEALKNPYDLPEEMRAFQATPPMTERVYQTYCGT